MRTLTVALCLGLLLSACGGGAPSGSTGASLAGSAPEEKVLNVYNWSDYIEPSVLSGFTQQTGIRVNYDVFDANEVLETKLLTGHTNYDVVVPSAPFLERQIKAGVFRVLDKSLLPNLKNLDPQMMKSIALYDPDNAHSVPYMWVTSGPGYNEAKIHERMADAPVDSFRMFYDPAVVAKFKDCGISVLDAPSEVIGTVLLFLGKDARSQSAEDLQAAEKVLLSIRPYLRYINSSRYIEDLANGEICLALGWSGDIKQARDRARDAGKGIDVRYAIPREGTIMNFDMLAIPADAPHPKNAHEFINYLLRPEVAAKNSNLVKYANVNSASTPLLDEAVRNDPNIYPPPQVAAKLVPEPPRSQEYQRQLTRAWTRFKTGE
ncbi:MAG: polyamine ABC transporter substrate-binding protein [Sinobacteraceae bacterium]|nr:polyamine ABC transporter substrate-binding protein [Nevskiaceae bacterium]MBV9914543.1 polyamine ABC transporter substrate-binding protein [Nevskiaceae bacterium]